VQNIEKQAGIPGTWHTAEAIRNHVALPAHDVRQSSFARTLARPFNHGRLDVHRFEDAGNAPRHGERERAVAAAQFHDVPQRVVHAQPVENQVHVQEGFQ